MAGTLVSCGYYMANVENDRQYVTEGTDEFKTAPKRAKILKCNKQLHAVQILLAAAFVAITSVSHGGKTKLKSTCSCTDRKTHILLIIL